MENLFQLKSKEKEGKHVEKQMGKIRMNEARRNESPVFLFIRNPIGIHGKLGH